LENISDSEDISRVWESIKKNIKVSTKDSLGLYEQKQHKAWFDEEFSQFLGQRKQAKMQWSQNPDHSNVDNLNSVRSEIIDISGRIRGSI
jgi:hypothetical protein